MGEDARLLRVALVSSAGPCGVKKKRCEDGPVCSCLALIFALWVCVWVFPSPYIKRRWKRRRVGETEKSRRSLLKRRPAAGPLNWITDCISAWTEVSTSGKLGKFNLGKKKKCVLEINAQRRRFSVCVKGKAGGERGIGLYASAPDTRLTRRAPLLHSLNQRFRPASLWLKCPPPPQVPHR